MCVIIKIPSGKTFPEDKLKNAVYNNAHGFGMLEIVPKKKGGGFHLELTTLFNEDDLDPEEVIKAINGSIEYDRVIHLRNTSAGVLSEDNLQPIYVGKDSQGNENWFLHNGTFHKYSNTRSTSGGRYINGQYQSYNYDVANNTNDDDNKSDSVHFVEKYLSPLIEDGLTLDNKVLIKHTVEDEWSMAAGRALLIRSTSNANQTQELMLQEKDWKEVDGFICSNDDYFDTIKRGKEFERRKKIREAEEQKKRQEEREKGGGGNTTSTSIASLSQLKQRARNYILDLNIIKKFLGSVNFDEIFDDTGQFDQVEPLLAVTNTEWVEFMKVDPESCAELINTSIKSYLDLEESLSCLEEKSDKQQEHIKRLAEEKKFLEEFLKEEGIKQNVA